MTVGLGMFVRGQVVFQGFSWDVGVILLFLLGNDREKCCWLRELSRRRLVLVLLGWAAGELGVVVSVAGGGLPRLW